MTPKVSVVMPSYNHAPYVRRAVESVLAQSFADLELVITDDGSVDGTPDIIRSIADPRIRLNVLPENRGACVAMNDAISRARGEYVAALNSDDYFLPGKLERQVQLLDARPELGAIFGMPLFVDEQGAPLRRPPRAFATAFPCENWPRVGWLRRFFDKGNCLCHPTAMLRRRCYEVVGRFDPWMMQLADFDLWIRLCREFEIAVLPEPLTAYRITRRERNVSAPSPQNFARCGWETSQILRHYTALPEASIRAVVDPSSRSPGVEARVLLALAALRSERPGYRPFGCELLLEILRTNPAALQAPTYFKLVGECDPFQTGYSAPEYRLLRRTGLPAAIRAVLSWIPRP